jgi:hypothetical protein
MPAGNGPINFPLPTRRLGITEILEEETPLKVNFCSYGRRKESVLMK